MFAVVRWTNLWFLVKRGSLWEDYVGRPLQPLYGVGIKDIPIQGNQPQRLAWWGRAHTKYFGFPANKDPEGVAELIHQTEDLGLYSPLVEMLGAPAPARQATPARLSTPANYPPETPPLTNRHYSRSTSTIDACFS